MGTYTTNYQLYMPTVGETGWGTLVNGNFTTIDTTMKSLSNLIAMLETETDAMKEKLDAFNVDTDGSIVGTFKGNVIGNVTGNLNGVITINATVVTSAPYDYDNIAIGSIGSFQSGNKTIAFPAIPATIPHPLGTYTMDRPSIEITYTIRFTASTGHENIIITYDDTQVFNGQVTINDKYAEFSITYDTAVTSTLVCSSATSNSKITPDITTLYLKRI